MSLAFDESGRPFIILREQGKKKRVKGLEAHKINILAARTVASLLKTSLGPKGMDKMLVSPDGEVIITNDGATILEKMEVSSATHLTFLDPSSNCQAPRRALSLLG